MNINAYSKHVSKGFFRKVNISQAQTQLILHFINILLSFIFHFVFVFLQIERICYSTISGFG